MLINEDTYYIKQVLKGNVNAFSGLVDRHKRMAYTLALKLVQVPEDAEEIAQDAFVKAYQSLGTFKGESKFSTWLYKIVFNIAISRLRKKQPDLVLLDDDHKKNFDIEDSDDFLSQIASDEKDAIVRSAISKLAAEEQALVILYYMDGNTIKEISYITGDSESNVKIKLFRIRKRLWEIMKYSFEEYEKK